MVKLITVHGTFAGDKADRGEKWWQQGSAFLERLQSHIQERLEIEPFHWSGENSEIERRRAGFRLFNTIKDSAEPPILVGHSHGGSAILHALVPLVATLNAAAADRLRGIVTIGMPMILFKDASINPISNFNVFGKILAITGLGLGAMAIAMLMKSEFRILGGLTLLLAIAAGVTLYLHTLRDTKRKRLFRRNTIGEAVGGKALSLSHGQDEAINALKNGINVHPRLVQFRQIYGGVFSGLATVFTAILLALVSIGLYTDILEQNAQPELDYAQRVIENASGFLGGDQNAPMSQEAVFQNAEDVAFLLLGLVFCLGVLLGLAAVIAAIIAYILAPIASNGVSNALRNVAFGNDGYGEKAIAVKANIDFAEGRSDGLPEAIQQEMLEASALDAAAAVRRFREILQKGALGIAESGDMLAMAATFERSELLHNAYFHSPLFVKYMAAIFIERYGLTPSPEVAGDPDFVWMREAAAKL